MLDDLDNEQLNTDEQRPLLQSTSLPSIFPTCIPLHSLVEFIINWIRPSKTLQENEGPIFTRLEEEALRRGQTSLNDNITRRLETLNFINNTKRAFRVSSNDLSLQRGWNKKGMEPTSNTPSRHRPRSSMQRLFKEPEGERTVLKSQTTEGLGEGTEWRIRAAEAQQTRRQPPRRHSHNWDLEKQTTIDCGSTTSQWLDLFREKYRSWTSSWQTTSTIKHESSVISRFLTPEIKSAKTVYLIRHGTAYCNVCRCTHWMEDQRLTPRGWNQVALLRSHLETIPPPEVVFTSTLSRAMETAVGAFGAPCKRGVKSERQSLLMRAQPSVHNLQSGNPGILYKDNTPPIIAIEDCRERLGDGVVPNKRRKLSEAKRQFPGIDLSLVQHEEDTLFARFDRPIGETEEEILNRSRRLMQFLIRRPESRIAVVSHGHFLSYLLNLQHHGEEFCNAELRPFQLSGTTWRPISTELCFKPFFGSHLEI